MIVLPQIVERIGVGATALLIAGGIAYTVGAVVYARRRPDPFRARSAITRSSMLWWSSRWPASTRRSRSSCFRRHDQAASGRRRLETAAASPSVDRDRRVRDRRGRRRAGRAAHHDHELAAGRRSNRTRARRRRGLPCELRLRALGWQQLFPPTSVRIAADASRPAARPPRAASSSRFGSTTWSRSRRYAASAA